MSIITLAGDGWLSVSDGGAHQHSGNEGVDEGKIIAQSLLDISHDDTPESLDQRVQILEHSLYPDALASALEQLINQSLS